MIGFPKPPSRKKTQRLARQTYADHVAAVRAYVFGRERGICRCCRVRPAESMHEIVFKSLGGKVSRKNSIAVCGDGVQGCHGFIQRHAITINERANADRLLHFTANSASAADWMRIAQYETIASWPGSQNQEAEL